MEYLTVKDAAWKASICLNFIEAAVKDNDGVSLIVGQRLSEAQKALIRLHDSLPSHMLSKTKNDYVYKNQNSKIMI